MDKSLLIAIGLLFLKEFLQTAREWKNDNKEELKKNTEALIELRSEVRHISKLMDEKAETIENMSVNVSRLEGEQKVLKSTLSNLMDKLS